MRPRMPPSSRREARPHAHPVRARPPPRAGGGPPTHPVAGPVAEQRGAHAAQVGQDQLALVRGASGDRVEDLGDELGLVHVQAGLRRALEAVGAHLGHARVIVGPGPPRRLDAGPHRGNPGPRLSRVDGRADAQAREHDPSLGRDLGQVERVGRRAADRGDPQALDRGQALRAVLAAAGDGERPERAHALEAGPEAHEEPEREREEHAVARPQPRRAEHHRPAAGPPVPGLLRVEPAERRPGGARRLVHPDVAVEREGQVGAERRMRRLVLHQLALGRERQALEVAPGPQISRVGQPGPRVAGAEKPVHRQRSADEGHEARPLLMLHGFGIERLHPKSGSTVARSTIRGQAVGRLPEGG
jgi:hypothetical protein